MKKIIIALVSVVVTSLYPVLFMFFQNADEVSFKQTLLPSSIFLMVGLGCTLLTGLLCRSIIKGSIGGILFVILFSNYAFIERGIQLILPQLKYWHILPILLVLIVHILYFIFNRFKQGTLQWINIFISIFMGGLIVFNLALAVPVLIEKNTVEIVKSDIPKDTIQTDDKMPNIYYLIFDEYSSFNNIKKYFQYDNSDFANFLLNKGFTISYDSYNESYYTTTILPNLVNLEYIVNDSTPAAEKKAYLYNGKLFNFMKSKGYTIKAVGAANAFNMKSETEKISSDAKTIGGESYIDLLLNNTIVYPFVQKNAYYRAKEILDAFSYFQNKEIYKQKKVFTMFYLMFPHEPFIFDEDGHARSHKDFQNWENLKFYLGQYIYATKLIRQQIETIIENDPDCIIILQSDHSARAISKNASITVSIIDRKNILNAVYYRGLSFEEIKGQSGLNTQRLIFSRLFALDLPLLEVPNNEEN